MAMASQPPKRPVVSESRRDADLEGQDPRIATTLARGLRILGAFRASDNHPLTNKEIAERSRLPKATVSRLIYTLSRLGFIAIDERSGGFRLAAGVLAPAYVYLSQLDIRAVARPIMKRLAKYPNVTVTMSARHELRMTTLDAGVADNLVPLVSFGGSAPIARTALGHAYLAGLKPAARSGLMAEMRDHYAVEWPAIEQRIERDVASVGRAGFCVVLGEWRPEISGVAAPVVIGDGELVLAISAGGPAKLLSADLLKRIGKDLTEACREIEYAAGRQAS